MTSVLNIQDVQHRYAKEGKVFIYPSLALQAGETVLVVGVSGVGKSTLLNILAGFISPENGEIEVCGKSYAQLSEKALEKHRAKCLGFVFQQSIFVESLSVKQNLKLQCKAAGVQWKESEVLGLLSSLNVEHTYDRMPNSLSIGEQQRVAIARAVVHKPKLVLADEPTSSLDDENTQQVFKLLQKVCSQQGTALLVVTHDTRLRSEGLTEVELK